MSKHQKIEIDELYWYCEDDIRDILRASVNYRANIFSQTQIEHQDLLEDNFRTAAVNASSYGTIALIPLHINGNHWASALMRRRGDGKIQLIYNDPLGNNIYSNQNGRILLDAIRQEVGEFDFIDISLRQQMNGSDCGPFSVDNMLNLLNFVLDPNKDPDNVTKEYLARNILSRPVDGNAREIRRQHADVVPRLVVDSANPSTSSQQLVTLEEIAQKKSDENFFKDAQKLLNLKDLINKINTLADKDEILRLLKQIGELSASLYRRESDGNSFRNIYGELLGLNTIEQLKFIDINDTARERLDNFAGYKANLISLSDTIDYILDNQRKKLESLAKDYSESKKLPYGFPAKGSVSKIQPGNFDKKNDLTLFTSSIYLPKAVQKIIDAINQLDPASALDFKKLEDRYAFCRIVAMIGELSRSIRYVIDKSYASEEFFKAMNLARNQVKTSNVHLKIIVEGVNGDNYSHFQNLHDNGFTNIKAALNNLLDDLRVISGNADYSSGLKGILNTAIPAVQEVKDFDHSLEIKNQDISLAKKALDNMINILSDFDKTHKSESNFNSQDFENLYNKLSQQEKLFFFPGGVVNSSFGVVRQLRTKKPPTPQGSKIPSQEMIDILGFIKDVKDYKTNIESVNKQIKLLPNLQKAIKEYRQALEKIPEEDRVDGSKDPLPKAEEKEIRNYKNKISSAQKKPKISKDDPLNFPKYCKEFDEELQRLEQIMKDDSSNKELAIAHCIGIMGEAIRFIFEIDEKDNSLSSLFEVDAIRDISNVRSVRNSQIMHGIFNYDADVVFRAADKQALSWKNDVRALSAIHQFIKIRKKNEDELFASIKKDNPNITKTQVQTRPLVYLADCYMRLGKFEEAEKNIKEFNDFYLLLSDQEKLEILEEKTIIDTLGSRLSLDKSGINDAKTILENSIINLGSQDDSNLSPSIIIAKARIYNNLGYLYELEGNYVQAKEYFEKCTQRSSGNVLSLYSRCQYASILFYEDGQKSEAVKIIDQAIFDEYRANKVSSGNIYELIMATRQKMVLQREMGALEESNQTFKIYHRLCSKTKLLKLSLGRNYKIVESMLLQDKASTSYNLGDYYEAINHWQNAISLLENLGISSKVETLGHCFLGIANCYKYLASVTQGSNEERMNLRLVALANYDKAQDIAKECKMEQSLFMAHCLAGEGQILDSMKKTSAARNSLKSAKDIYEDYGTSGKYYQTMSDFSSRSTKMNQKKRNTFYGKIAMDHDLESNNYYATSIELMKKNKFSDALSYLKLHKENMEREGFYNPVYASIIKNIIICCCRLRRPKEALENCKILDNFLIKHPDCDSGTNKDEINKNLSQIGKPYKWSKPDGKNLKPQTTLQGIKDLDKLLEKFKSK